MSDERHYNSKTLTIIFALSSVVLLGAIGLMAMDDYDRPWKKYQKKFQTLEIEKTRIKFDEQEKLLEADSTYQGLLEEINAANEAFATTCPDFEQIEQKISALQARDDQIQQKYKFSKAELDAAKYRYEEAKAHHKHNFDEVEGEYNALNSKVDQLKLDTEDSGEKLAVQTMRLAECKDQIKQLDRQARAMSGRADILTRKLKSIDPNAMTFTNRIAQLVRDLPIIDLANPSVKIEQIVLKDIHDDVNFMTVPKVDRCITCHLGISNPAYSNADQPFRAHPNLDQYVGKDSPHSLEEFGCTVCHGGRGRSTDFTGAVHTPSSPEQAKEWETKYNWKKFELWEDPMLPKAYVEAGCFKCHSDQSSIKGAETLNIGLELVERAGCYACHTIEKYKNWPKPGPNLNKAASKLTKDWAFHWIKSPHSFRSDTWMPSFFGQSNNSDPESIKRTDQEILSIVHYLFEKSEAYETRAVPYKGDSINGEKLIKSVGCMACHEIHAEDEESLQHAQGVSVDHIRQEFGPNLVSSGSKMSKEWIYNWIKNPKSYHNETRMPNLRLSDQEAADISEYLSMSHNKEYETKTAPSTDLKILDDIVSSYLKKDMTQNQASNQVSVMTQDEKLMYAGKKMIAHYGCYSCHNINGFEGVKPIGTELTEEGSKDIHKLDFGFVHIDHTKQAWFDQKLKDPRIFDEGKVKSPDEKLRMPNYYLTQDETNAITTALLGFIETSTVQGKIKAKTAREEFISEGQEIVRQFNCQGCHVIEGAGGSIQESVKEWLMEDDGRSESEAEAMVTSFSPPNLIGEGQKVKSQWLFEFLHKPTTIRPWLKTRMPTYEFNGEHLNSLVQYFNALDNSEFPFSEKVDTTLTDEEYATAEKLFSKEYFGCAQCHIVGDQLPAGSAESWAPNFALAQERLRPGWIIKWLENPEALLPGTKMPTYFDPSNFDASGPDDILDGDEHEQIRYLRNFLISIADKTPVAPKSSPVIAPPVQ